MPSFTAQLAGLLGDVVRPGDFFAAGTAELLPPALEVQGVGPVALPLLPAQAAQLTAVAEPAPYGRGTETIVDPAVRRCWQLGPDRVRLGGRHWARTLDAIVSRAAEGLGVPEPVTAEFYKLLLYGPGSFFISHRDTEKAPGMFATLVVVLPSAFTGGELILRHRDREVRLELRSDDPGEAAFAAFYADCVHEIRPVTEGHRLALVYNLLRRDRGRPPLPPDYRREQAEIVALLEAWRGALAQAEAEVPPEKLIYLLEHAYTPAELGFPALKGADAAVAGVLVDAAAQARCDLHLALLTVEESGAAAYADSYGSRRGRWDEEAFEAGEVSDRSVTLSEWRRPDGEVSVLTEIPVEADEIAPPDACDELEPDEEHFHEATGNEGASFERTYRRAALVLWPAERFFAVLSQAGLTATLPCLEDLVRRWEEGGQDRRLWEEGHALAGEMLTRWPKRSWHPGYERGASDASRMLVLLTRLGDAEMIGRFLTEITAAGDYRKSDNVVVIGALAGLSPLRAASVMERIIGGTAATSFAACADLLIRAAASWHGSSQTAALTGSAQRLIAAMPGGAARAPQRAAWEHAPAIEPGFVVDLMTALCGIDAALAEDAAEHLLTWAKTYDPDAVLIPAMRQLMRASVNDCGMAIERLRAACIVHLRARVSEELAPPVDWRRANKLPCRCPRCSELARFLADPGQKTWVFRAVESDRRHVEETIRQARCDVEVATDRSGRPYSLICTKNQASYERRAKQRRQDLKDLALFGEQ